MPTSWKLLLSCVLFLVIGFARAETQITDGVIVEVTERGFVLLVGTEPMAVDDESGTRFWRGFAAVDRTAFKPGDRVNLRLKTDGNPVILREMADVETAKWLANLRKTSTAATVVKVEPKSLTVKLNDGKEFVYRMSAKSDVALGGKTGSSADLQVGQRVYVQGRLLPNLDTWVVKIEDKAPVAKLPSARGPKAKAAKPLKLAALGKLRGKVDHHLPTHRMFDIWVEGRLIHVTYSDATRFLMDGKRVSPLELRKGIGAEVGYKRDTFGRLLASRVDLFMLD